MNRKSLKVVVIGGCGVGKTSLMTKYVQNIFLAGTSPTVGVDFFTKDIMINDNFVSLQIWDTAGQDRFHSICSSFYRGADCCIIVYDVTDPYSFENLNYWHNQFLIHAAPMNKDNFPIVLLGNKVDLPSREVSIVQAEAWCDSKNQCQYFETSAKDGTNVDVAFETVAKMALNRELQAKKFTFPRDCVFPPQENKWDKFRKC